MIFPYADENPAPGRDWEITGLVILNILAVVLWGLYGVLGFVPARPVWYTWVTSLFIHGDFWHLAGNMYALWLFGNKVAYRVGKWFLPFYFGGGLAANAADLLLRRGSEIPCVGASGAVCAIIAAYIVFFPSARMRCYMFLLYKFVQYNVSALVFGIIYVLTQFHGLQGGDGGVAYSAHVGGLAFGFIAALAWPERATAEPAAGQGPAAIKVNENGRIILKHLKNGDDELALQKYVEEARRDPFLEFPEASQLTLAKKLLDFGHPVLSKWAFSKMLRRAPESPAAFGAHLMVGYIEQTYQKDLASALSSYRRALPSPDAPIRQDAESRAKGVEKVLRRTQFYPPAEGDRFAVVRASTGTPSDDERRAVAAATGGELPGSLPWQVAFPLRDADQQRAAALAESLHAAGAAVFVVPERLVLGLPLARPFEGARADLDGLVFTGGTNEHRVAWKNCLLIAAVSAPVGGLKKKRAGMLEVEIENVVGVGLDGIETSEKGKEEYAQGEPVPCLEVVTLEPFARYRWTVPPEIAYEEAARGRFFQTLQDVALNAFNVPFNEGVQAAFGRALPEECSFENAAQLELYMLWQVQLARLKKEKSYA